MMSEYARMFIDYLLDITLYRSNGLQFNPWLDKYIQ